MFYAFNTPLLAFSKIVVPLVGTVGSNPTLSAKYQQLMTFEVNKKYNKSMTFFPTFGKKNKCENKKFQRFSFQSCNKKAPVFAEALSKSFIWI